jgi:hypothetical protein
MSLEQAAADACQYVRRELPLGARNITNPNRRAEETLEYARDYADKIGAETLEKRIDVAKRFGAGNCLEIAYLAYEYLRKTRPTDGICLVTVDLHMTVGLGLFPFVVDARFDIHDVADTVVFCDEWLAQWAKSEQKDGKDWVQAGDLTGVYHRARYCELLTLEGEDVTNAKVVRKRRVD